MSKKNNTEAPETKGKALGVIVDIVLVIAIIIALFCTYSAYVSKTGKGVPSLLGYSFLSIQSDSMVPVFSEGDMIIDKLVKDTDELKEGDIITFWTVIDGYRVLNTHRIVGVNPGENFTYFYTKGDNNSQVDATTVHESEIVGVYQSSIKGLGKVFDFLQTAKGFFCVIVIPVFLFFVYYLVSFFKVLFEYKKAKDRMEFEAERKLMDEAQGMDNKKDAPKAQEISSNDAEDTSQGNKSDTSGDNITLTKEQLLALLKQAGIDPNSSNNSDDKDPNNANNSENKDQ